MDALCYNDLDAFGVELNDPPQELVQDLYHRMIEDPGSNADDPDRGLGIVSRLNGPVDPKLNQDINNEFCKDDRVHATTSLITPLDTPPGAYRIEITVEVDSGKLSLVAVSDGIGGISQVTPS